MAALPRGSAPRSDPLGRAADTTVDREVIESLVPEQCQAAAARRKEWKQFLQKSRAAVAWHYALVEHVGARDVCDLMDRAVAELAERQGLPPCPPEDGPPGLAAMLGRWSPWHRALAECMRAQGVWDPLNQALVEFAERAGFAAYAPDFGATGAAEDVTGRGRQHRARAPRLTATRRARTATAANSDTGDGRGKDRKAMDRKGLDGPGGRGQPRSSPPSPHPSLTIIC